METIKLSGESLHNIYQSSKTAESVLNALAHRQRIRDFSDIIRLKHELMKSGEKVIDGDFMKLWKDLQTQGVGVIVNGRNGKATRFVWHYGLKTVANAAITGKDEEVKKLEPNSPKEKPTKRRYVRKASVAETKDITTTSEKLVFIPLRPDFEVSIKLPGDITNSELESIKNAIQRVA